MEPHIFDVWVPQAPCQSFWQLSLPANYVCELAAPQLTLRYATLLRDKVATSLANLHRACIVEHRSSGAVFIILLLFIPLAKQKTSNIVFRRRREVTGGRELGILARRCGRDVHFLLRLR